MSDQNNNNGKSRRQINEISAKLMARYLVRRGGVYVNSHKNQIAYPSDALAKLEKHASDVTHKAHIRGKVFPDERDVLRTHKKVKGATEYALRRLVHKASKRYPDPETAHMAVKHALVGAEKERLQQAMLVGKTPSINMQVKKFANKPTTVPVDMAPAPTFKARGKKTGEGGHGKSQKTSFTPHNPEESNLPMQHHLISNEGRVVASGTKDHVHKERARRGAKASSTMSIIYTNHPKVVKGARLSSDEIKHHLKLTKQNYRNEIDEGVIGSGLRAASRFGARHDKAIAATAATGAVGTKMYKDRQKEAKASSRQSSSSGNGMIAGLALASMLSSRRRSSEDDKPAYKGGGGSFDGGGASASWNESKNLAETSKLRALGYLIKSNTVGQVSLMRKHPDAVKHTLGYAKENGERAARGERIKALHVNDLHPAMKARALGVARARLRIERPSGYVPRRGAAQREFQHRTSYQADKFNGDRTGDKAAPFGSVYRKESFQHPINELSKTTLYSYFTKARRAGEAAEKTYRSHAAVIRGHGFEMPKNMKHGMLHNIRKHKSGVAMAAQKLKGSTPGQSRALSYANTIVHEGMSEGAVSRFLVKHEKPVAFGAASSLGLAKLSYDEYKERKANAADKAKFTRMKHKYLPFTRHHKESVADTISMHGKLLAESDMHNIEAVVNANMKKNHHIQGLVLSKSSPHYVVVATGHRKVIHQQRFHHIKRDPKTGLWTHMFSSPHLEEGVIAKGAGAGAIMGGVGGALSGGLAAGPAGAVLGGIGGAIRGGISGAAVGVGIKALSKKKKNGEPDVNNEDDEQNEEFVRENRREKENAWHYTKKGAKVGAAVGGVSGAAIGAAGLHRLAKIRGLPRKGRLAAAGIGALVSGGYNAISGALTGAPVGAVYGAYKTRKAAMNEISPALAARYTQRVVQTGKRAWTSAGRATGLRRASVRMMKTEGAMRNGAIIGGAGGAALGAKVLGKWGGKIAGAKGAAVGTGVGAIVGGGAGAIEGAALGGAYKVHKALNSESRIVSETRGKPHLAHHMKHSTGKGAAIGAGLGALVSRNRYGVALGALGGAALGHYQNTKGGRMARYNAMHGKNIQELSKPVIAGLGFIGGVGAEYGSNVYMHKVAGYKAAATRKKRMKQLDTMKNGGDIRTNEGYVSSAKDTVKRTAIVSAGIDAATGAGFGAALGRRAGGKGALVGAALGGAAGLVKGAADGVATGFGVHAWNKASPLTMHRVPAHRQQVAPTAEAFEPKTLKGKFHKAKRDIGHAMTYAHKHPVRAGLHVASKPFRDIWDAQKKVAKGAAVAGAGVAGYALGNKLFNSTEHEGNMVEETEDKYVVKQPSFKKALLEESTKKTFTHKVKK